MATSSHLNLYKSEAVGARGMLATKHPLASAAGVTMLKAGGNAVDAAVAACLAVGVVEPGASGIGGGGYMMVAIGNRVDTVAFQMQAPAAATPEMFTLSGDPTTGVFEWAGVVDNENLIGPRSIAIPGAVAGLSLALERFGTMPWSEVIQPAIHLARDGFEIGWYDLHAIAGEIPRILPNAETTRIFLRDGGPPAGDGTSPGLFQQPDLASTLERLADAGPRDFYEGDVACEIAAGIGELGGILTLDDLTQYSADIVSPLRSAYRGVSVCVPPFACAGPTSIATLNTYRHFEPTTLGYESPERLHAYISCSRLARADRMAYFADPEKVEVPWEGMASSGYALERASLIGPDTVPEFAPGDPWDYQTGSGHGRSSGHHGPEGSTTHLCAADADGNMVSLTNTIMAGFGSGVVPRGTGVVMNNGMMWFNPVPGLPNSVSPLAQGLNNMTPAVVLDGDRPLMAVGATGGRRITNPGTQNNSNVVDHDMGIQAAIAAPRVDCSTDTTDIDDRFPSSVVRALRDRGHQVNPLRLTFWAGFGTFASPAGIIRADGELRGGVDPFHGAEARGV